MGVWLGPRGKPRYKMPPIFEYNGVRCDGKAYMSVDGLFTYRVQTAGDGTVNWELAIYSGNRTNLRFSRVVDQIDAFYVGPGAKGESGYAGGTDGKTAYGGRGGAGGETKTVSGIAVSSGVDYPITIGTPGTATSAFGNSAASGGGYAGGTGSHASNNNPVLGTAGRDGNLSFGGAGIRQHWTAVKFGAPGGGGGARSANGTIAAPTSGGSSNAGAGGAYGNDGGDATLAGSGAGGGGGSYDLAGGYDRPGGDGASGILIIRNH